MCARWARAHGFIRLFMSLPLSSLSSQPRILSLDRIRGFSILGILLMNIFAIATPLEAYVSPLWNQGTASALDIYLFQFSQLFFNGRFMNLFALLFGAGLMIQLSTKDERAIKKRLQWLMLFGILHGCFIWFGDILMMYGLTGWVLIHYRLLHKPVHDLLRQALIFFMIGLLFPTLLYVITPSEDEMFSAVLTLEKINEAKALATGSYLEQFIEQAGLMASVVIDWVFMLFWMIASLMMLGVALFKSEFFKKGFAVKFEIILFVGAVFLTSISLSIQQINHYSNQLEMLSPLVTCAMLMMALVYASRIIKLSDTGWFHRVFAPAGKMAFTLYICQSSVMVLIFHWWQPQWFAELDRLTLLSGVILFILVQLVFSHLYLKVFNQGPLETLWRRLAAS
jgi:uncharacterized protein